MFVIKEYAEKPSLELSPGKVQLPEERVTKAARKASISQIDIHSPAAVYPGGSGVGRMQ